MLALAFTESRFTIVQPHSHGGTNPSEDINSNYSSAQKIHTNCTAKDQNMGQTLKQHGQLTHYANEKRTPAKPGSWVEQEAGEVHFFGSLVLKLT
ncbi:hypothetical protein P7K49_018994 [Saguinus oedipus]|uniref:Uncharacterized protein n=1 Tax=Saguinus oedipus TaxID=9490 RepID=A0ABQ9UW26_SAGOE|nr:hypothetical protein P7K49_018994 [Saguinus oedipus]